MPGERIMTDKQLEYFIKTAEYHSMNEAANDLYVSRPSLNYAITSLEEELGYPLFVRTKQGISLTSSGERILEEARQILSTIEGWKKNPAGEEDFISIYSSIALSALIPNIIFQLSKSFPKLKISSYNLQHKNLVHQNLYEKKTILFQFFSEVEHLSMLEHIAKAGWQYHLLHKGITRVAINKENPLSGGNTVSLATLLPKSTVTGLIPRDEQMYPEFWQKFPDTQFLLLSTDEARWQMVSINPDVITLATDFAIKRVEAIYSDSIRFLDVNEISLNYYLYMIYSPDIEEKYTASIKSSADGLIRELFDDH